MKLIITTYDKEGEEVIAREFDLENDLSHGDKINDILEDSHEYVADRESRNLDDEAEKIGDNERQEK